MIVSKHMGWVHNVVLMNVYLGLEKPQGFGISDGGPDGQVRETKGSVYEQPEKEVDGSCHSRRVPSKWKGAIGKTRGARG
jgi:hypothetical protein